MTPAELFQISPAFLMVTITLLGLCVGSFLNVVAYRLPVMIDKEFECACREQFGTPTEESTDERFDLSYPPSACPKCQTRIKPWHNLPMLGWLLLRGRCAACSERISFEYPLVEFLTGAASAICVWKFGYSIDLLAALILTWALIALTVTDLHTMYLPDAITLPLLWVGLLFSLNPVFAPSPQAAILGAAAGYLLLWSVFWIFKLLTGKEGMGFGDFKLMAALGAWLGISLLPQIIFLSALTGAAVGLFLITARKAEMSSKIPFGPYIAGAGWIAMMWGTEINQLYLGQLG